MIVHSDSVFTEGLGQGGAQGGANRPPQIQGGVVPLRGERGITEINCFRWFGAPVGAPDFFGIFLLLRDFPFIFGTDLKRLND